VQVEGIVLARNCMLWAFYRKETACVGISEEKLLCCGAFADKKQHIRGAFCDEKAW